MTPSEKHRRREFRRLRALTRSPRSQRKRRARRRLGRVTSRSSRRSVDAVLAKREAAFFDALVIRIWNASAIPLDLIGVPEDVRARARRYEGQRARDRGDAREILRDDVRA